MTYFTKDWFNIKRVASLCVSVEESDIVGDFDESVFEKIYNEKLEEYFRTEYDRLKPFSPESLPWAEKLLSKYEISESIKWELKRALWIKANDSKKIESFQIDKELVKKRFDMILKNEISDCQKLPSGLLAKIADIRVFCLGYATKEVKAEAVVYGTEKQEESKSIRELVQKETEKAERPLKLLIGLNKYFKAFLIDIKREGENICMNFKFHPPLIITEAKVLEQESIFYRPLTNIADTAITTIEGLELQKNGDWYELSFLMFNRTRILEETLWYYTVKGKNIIMG